MEVENTGWENIKVDDIVTCSSYEGFHKVVRFNRAKRFGPFMLVIFKTWNQKTGEFYPFERNALLCNLAPAKDDLAKQIAGLQSLLS